MGWDSELFLRLKTTSWTGFIMLGLKLVFQLRAQSLILLKSFFQWEFETATSVIVENKEVSPIKKF